MSLSSVAISASAKAGKRSEKDANIIEFVESPWGLKMTLFPVQRVILKAHTTDLSLMTKTLSRSLIGQGRT